MKLRLVALAVAVLALHGVSASAVPLSFSDTYDFDSVANPGMLEINNNHPYAHTVVFDPAAVSILEASLALTHQGNGDDAAELWILENRGGTVFIGQLSTSTTGWHTDTFSVPPWS